MLKFSACIFKFLFNFAFASSFVIFGVTSVLSVCEFRYPVDSIPSISPLSKAIFTFIRSG